MSNTVKRTVYVLRRDGKYVCTYDGQNDVDDPLEAAKWFSRIGAEKFCALQGIEDVEIVEYEAEYPA